MSLLKKISPEWFPAENPELAVGETIEITDPEWLLKSGTAVEVDAKGNEVKPTEPELLVGYLERKQLELERQLAEKDAAANEVKGRKHVEKDRDETKVGAGEDPKVD